MADSPSEIIKNERNKAITISPSIAAHSVGLHVPIKLTRENFLLWKTQMVRRYGEVVDFTRSRVKNNSKLTNLMKMIRIEGYNGK